MSFSDVLKSRDMNAQQPPSPTKYTNAKPSNNLHRQALNSYNNSSNAKENHSQAYVSPSDAIMSPASQKLSSFKQKQMNKSMPKPRSLFAKTVTTRAKDLGPVNDEQK